jgi:predicted ferric reductase
MKNKAGNFAIILLVVLNVLVWVIFSPVDDGQISRVRFLRTYAGEVIGSTVIILISVSLFLATRPKWAEPFFGGLDKMYQTHRRNSTAAFLLIFVHVLTVPITTENLRLGNYLGIIAFTGIVLIVLVTLAPRIPFLNKLTGETYEGWRKVHRYIGIFFIIGFIHSLTVNSLDALIAISWVQIFFIIGTASYLYTEIFGRYFRQSLPYIVEAVDALNGSVSQVTLRAKNVPIKKPRAGQFLFVWFPGIKILNESHPFTISSAPAEDVLRLTIKASGDFTRALHQTLKAGDEAIVMGAYGMFDYKTGRPDQIWIAGGIGLTPFLAFIRDLDQNLKHHVEFFYTVRHPEEALFLDELEEAAALNPYLNLHVRFSAVDGALSVAEIVRNVGEDIRSYDVYLCGPIPMVKSFTDQFMRLSVPADQIHYEEFNFR